MEPAAASRLVVGPFNRVEGDLQVRLEIAAGRVREAFVTATMYRGFEQILPGRPPADALTIVPRICGICSLSQSVAAARALAQLSGIEPPPNGVHAVNLMSAVENLADHITHFYLFFMPDFARAAYAGRPWHAQALQRFAAGEGAHVKRAIAARARWMQMMGTLAGRWPMSGSVVPGGSTRAVQAAERLQLLALLREFRAFVEDTLLGAPLEQVAALRDERDLARWVAAEPGRGDLRLFIAIADDLGLHEMGAGPGRYLCSGAYPQPDGAWPVPAGLWRAEAGAMEALDLDDVAEDCTRAWLEDGAPAGRPAPPRHPAQGHTQPQADKPGAYTWAKAPRLAGQVVETGAIARQLAAAQPLLHALVARHGGNVATRVVARVLEVAQVLPWMERWLAALVPGEPFNAGPGTLRDGQATGSTEAARGALGHWVTVQGGRIAQYQIVAPTTWNFSPRDAAGTPGALEAALVGTPVRPGETMPVAVQHVVRSFDPCMVCTVH
jgi:hydrogenase large subunit